MPEKQDTLDGGEPVPAPEMVKNTIPMSDATDASAAGKLQFEVVDQYPPLSNALFPRGTCIAGRYKILEQIGEGGMGVVFLAEQISPITRRVALKLIRFGLDSPGARARFDQERQMLAILEHENIAKVFDGGVTEQGFPFIVMELVRGVPITKFCDDQKLPLKNRLNLFMTVCHAVQHAHQKGIIHRDLKPGNIIVTENAGIPNAKVIDFGVAKAMHQRLTDQTIFTERGSIVGTLEYMAPEQAGTNQLDIDTRADIYSLGAILCELLTGSTPFTRQQLRDTTLDVALRLIREADPPRPSTKLSQDGKLREIATARHADPARLSQDIAGDLDWIVLRCLEKDRNRRYNSVDKLAGDIQHYLRDEPIAAHPPSQTYRLKKYIKRHRGAVLATAFVVSALLTGLVLMYLGMVRARDAEQLAKLENDIKSELLSFFDQKLFGLIDSQEQAKLGLPIDVDLKVRDLLDRASREISDNRFGNRPLTEAALRHTIGRAYLALGLLSEGRSHLETALQLKSSYAGRKQLDTLKTIEALAEAYLSQGAHEQARTLILEVLNERVAQLGRSAPESLDALYILSTVDYTQGKYADAQKHLENLLSLDGGNSPARRNETLTAKNLLASAHHFQKNYTKSDALFAQIVREADSALSLNHPTRVQILHNYAQSLQSRNQDDEALKIFEELIPAASRTYGEEHIMSAMYKHNYAGLCIRLRKLAKANQLFHEIMPIFTKRFGNDHFRTALNKGTYAYLKYLMEDYPAAIATYREVRPLYVKHFGLKNSQTLVLTKDMITVLIEAKEVDEAISLAREYVALRGAVSDIAINERIATQMAKLIPLAIQSGKRTQITAMLKDLEEPLKANPQLLAKLKQFAERVD